MTIRLFLSALFKASAALLFSACSFESQDAYAESRRQTLLATYPPGKATQEDIQKSLGTKPMETFHRPANGWEAHPDRTAAYFGAKAEKRIGKKIPLSDQYFTPRGLMGISYSRFYFDSRHRLLDAEWQWSSD